MNVGGHVYLNIGGAQNADVVSDLVFAMTDQKFRFVVQRLLQVSQSESNNPLHPTTTLTPISIQCCTLLSTGWIQFSYRLDFVANSPLG